MYKNDSNEGCEKSKGELDQIECEVFFHSFCCELVRFNSFERGHISHEVIQMNGK